jgi:hypothetical protein
VDVLHLSARLALGACLVEVHDQVERLLEGFGRGIAHERARRIRG